MHTLPLTVHPTPAPWHALRCPTKVLSPKETEKPSKHCTSSLNRTPSSKRLGTHNICILPHLPLQIWPHIHHPSLPSSSILRREQCQDQEGRTIVLYCNIEVWSELQHVFGPVHSGDLTHYSCCPLIRQPCLLYFLINITYMLWSEIEIGVWYWDCGWRLRLGS